MIIRKMFDTPYWRLQSPFQEIVQMRREMDRLFENLPGRPFGTPRAGVYPLINLTEDTDSYYVQAELPGLKANELNISATGNNLAISGERKIPSEGENVRYHRREREAGSFNRVVALPGEVNVNKVEAKLTHGILTVTVPKAEAAKPKQITVK